MILEHLYNDTKSTVYALHPCDYKYCKCRVTKEVYKLQLNKDEFEQFGLNKKVRKWYANFMYRWNSYNVQLCPECFNKLLHENKDELILAVI